MVSALRGYLAPARDAMLFNLKSGNTKLGRECATTFAPIGVSCPNGCPLRDSGCYAQDGFVAMHEKRIANYARERGLSSLDVAHAEAALILDHAPLSLERPLRLHVSGDCRGEDEARILSSACTKWRGPVWTYTHSWREIRRETWAPISVLASIEDAKDGSKALTRGYAPALIVADHPASGRAFHFASVRWIPCPAQTRDDVTCASCRLCFDSQKLVSRRSGITFQIHGSRRSLKRATSKLVQRRLPLVP